MISHTQKGMSLIELMVALVIGSVLVLGLVEVFSASKTSYTLAQGLARTQENGRFAMEFLQRDLRAVGHFGCVSDQAHFQATNKLFGELFLTSRGDYDTLPTIDHSGALAFNLSITGYEANGTGPDATITLPAVPTAGGGTDWAPALPRLLTDTGIPAPVRGSDIVVLRFLSAESAAVTRFAAAAGQIDVNTAELNVMNKNVQNPGLYGVADCRAVTLFHIQPPQANGATTTLTISPAAANNINQSAFNISDNYDGLQARLYRAESVIYYVGLNTDDPANPTPSLYRLRFNAVPGSRDISRKAEELVPGVENLQLLYGQDSNLAETTRPTGFINQTRVASAVPNGAGNFQNGWHRVGAVKIGMLVRSPDLAGAPPSGSRGTFVLGTRVNAADDKRYRSVYESNVALRNRLFGN